MNVLGMIVTRFACKSVFLKILQSFFKLCKLMSCTITSGAIANYTLENNGSNWLIGWLVALFIYCSEVKEKLIFGKRNINIKNIIKLYPL